VEAALHAIPAGSDDGALAPDAREELLGKVKAVKAAIVARFQASCCGVDKYVPGTECLERAVSGRCLQRGVHSLQVSLAPA
jgi:hypothetical protein